MMPRAGNISTPDRTDQMLALWGDGLSAGKIALAMGGTTRNTVIGRLDRFRTAFLAKRLTLEQIAEIVAEGGDYRQFDGDYPLGSYGFAAIRRMMGGQAA